MFQVRSQSPVHACWPLAVAAALLSPPALASQAAAAAGGSSTVKAASSTYRAAPLPVVAPPPARTLEARLELDQPSDRTTPGERFVLLAQGPLVPEVALTGRARPGLEAAGAQAALSAAKDLGPVRVEASAALTPAGALEARASAALLASLALAPGWSLTAGPTAGAGRGGTSSGFLAAAAWSPAPELVLSAVAETGRPGVPGLAVFASLGWSPGAGAAAGPGAGSAPLRTSVEVLLDR